MSETADKVDVGDVVTLDQQQEHFIVGHITPPLTLLVPMVNNNKIMVVNNKVGADSMHVVSKGRGILTEDHIQRVKETMEAWAYAPLLPSMERGIESLKRVNSFNSNRAVYVQVSGFVAEELALKWQQMSAMMDLYAKAYPGIPDMQKSFLEWMLFSLYNFLEQYPHLRRRQEGDQ